jgi:hypothetical protein
MADFRHVETIAAAKRSGKLPPGVPNEMNAEITSLVPSPQVMMSPLSNKSAVHGMALCRKLHQKQIRFGS